MRPGKLGKVEDLLSGWEPDPNPADINGKNPSDFSGIWISTSGPCQLSVLRFAVWESRYHLRTSWQFLQAVTSCFLICALQTGFCDPSAGICSGSQYISGAIQGVWFLTHEALNGLGPGDHLSPDVIQGWRRAAGMLSLTVSLVLVGEEWWWEAFSEGSSAL